MSGESGRLPAPKQADPDRTAGKPFVWLKARDEADCNIFNVKKFNSHRQTIPYDRGIRERIAADSGAGRRKAKGDRNNMRALTQYRGRFFSRLILSYTLLTVVLIGLAGGFLYVQANRMMVGEIARDGESRLRNIRDFVENSGLRKYENSLRHAALSTVASEPDLLVPHEPRSAQGGQRRRPERDGVPAQGRLRRRPHQLGRGVKLGLMPGDGIVRILNGRVREPYEEAGGGGPRCELYVYVDDPDRYFDRVVRAGGRGISRGATRSWGDFVAYGSDDDGHLIAFARPPRDEGA